MATPPIIAVSATLNPIPGIPDKCLQEGQELLSVTIDFTALPLINTAVDGNSALVNLGCLAFDTAYAQYDFNVAGAGIQRPLSQIRSVIWSFRPQYGQVQGGSNPPYIDSNGPEQIPVLTITNPTTLQTLYIGNPSFANSVTRFCGAAPFFGQPGCTARFINKACQDGIVRGIGTFIFTNFDVPPFDVVTYDSIS
jgi:hypothetical protein